MKVLVTGGAGFIGSTFVRYLLTHYPDYEVTVLDDLTYAGRMENLHDLEGDIRFIRGSICSETDVSHAAGKCELVFNFAAESHVDRSIKDPGTFVQTNVWGTYVLLEAALGGGVERFVQISTDEVYGSPLEGSSSEDDTLEPSSPYSASKAAADLLALSYFKTFGLPVLITRSSNNFGPYQYPEKIIPLFILNSLDYEPLPVYGDGRNVRDWVHVSDNCAAVDLVARSGVPGGVYNIGGNNGRQNLEIAHLILGLTGRPKELVRFVDDRPGHDKRYALDTSKIEELGWRSDRTFEDDLRQTVEWYQTQEWWWKPLR